MTQCEYKSCANVTDSFPHHATFNCIMTHNVNLNANPKMNETTVKLLSMNKTIATHHVGHSCTPIDQTINKIFMYCYILLNTTIQPCSTNNGCIK